MRPVCFRVSNMLFKIFLVYTDAAFPSKNLGMPYLFNCATHKPSDQIEHRFMN